MGRPPPISRRSFLRGAAAATTLFACGAPPGTAPGRTPVAVAVSPDQPVERGATLRVLQWRDYLAPAVVEAFVRRHAQLDVDLAIESFTSMPEAVARLRSDRIGFDVVFPSMEALAGLVGEGLLRPLTHELVPNGRHLWPFFRDGPFYDPGQRFSVPYTVYTTGIGWRRDLVPGSDAPPNLANPYDVFWDPRYRGAVGIYDDYREGIALALLRRGVDPNTGDAAAVEAAVDDLIQMAARVHVEVSATGAYHELQTGDYAVQQAWSGDLLSADRFGVGTARGAEEIAYTWPSGGIVGCDLTSICATGRNPVLAHRFIDHLLDEGIALRNFAWNGYQPPVSAAEREALRGSRWSSIVPDQLWDTILAPDDLTAGRFLVRLAPDQEARYRVGWQRFLAST